jgi:hypothetical protein
MAAIVNQQGDAVLRCGNPGRRGPVQVLLMGRRLAASAVEPGPCGADAPRRRFLVSLQSSARWVPTIGLADSYRGNLCLAAHIV